MKKIEFYKHNLDKKDKREVHNVLSSIFLTTGQKVKEFETKFAKYFGAKYCVGVTSCTEALFLSLKGLDIDPGDEVITTPMSFISTSNAIEYCQAKPVFVDIENSTGNINADSIEKKINKKTKAILITHLYGQMCDMRKIRKIAKKYKLKVIEDCAHAIESHRDGIKPGQISDAACFSFYATKNITSGEGGAIVTNSKSLYEWLLKARNHGMRRNANDRYKKEQWDMEELGYKANMTNIQAALLINQLERIEKLLFRKYQIARRFNEGFSKNPNIKTILTLPDSKHAKHLYTIQVKPKKRDWLLDELQKKGIRGTVHFMPIHLTKYYRKKYGYKKGDFPIAEKFGDSTITLPFYPKLKDSEINFIFKTVNKLTYPKV